MKLHPMHRLRLVFRAAIGLVTFAALSLGTSSDANAYLACASYHIDAGPCGEHCGMKCQDGNGGFNFYGMDCGADIFQNHGFDIEVNDPCDTGIHVPPPILDATHGGTLVSGLSDPNLAGEVLWGAGVSYITGTELNEYLAAGDTDPLPDDDFEVEPTAVISDEVVAQLVVVIGGSAELNKAVAALEDASVTWDVDPLRLSRGVIRHCGALMARLSEESCDPDDVTLCQPEE